ncbi:MAG: hypothetical protein ABR553_01155 [Gammaproteobacteria bacterium]
MAVTLRKLRMLVWLAGVAFGAIPLAAQSDTPLPSIPEANARYSDAQGCVEPTEDMRKNHMNFILHQRDATMHEGIRTRQHALEECINCHVPGDDSGKIVRYGSAEHFCSSCHTYAAVKIDCFQCHADRPVQETAFHPLTGAGHSHHADTRVDTQVSPGLLKVLANEGKLQ